jgi:hypothetical protein
MRLAALAIGFVLALGGIATAQPYDTPEALMEAFYAPYLAGSEAYDAQDYDDQATLRSAALQALYEEDEAATPEGDVGTLDFDPYIGGQDWTLSDFKIGEAVIDGDTASIDVSFKNFDEPRNLTYELVMEDGGWKVNDLVSKTPGDEFRLSEIFILAHAD